MVKKQVEKTTQVQIPGISYGRGIENLHVGQLERDENTKWS